MQKPYMKRARAAIMAAGIRNTASRLMVYRHERLHDRFATLEARRAAYSTAAKAAIDSMLAA